MIPRRARKYDFDFDDDDLLDRPEDSQTLSWPELLLISLEQALAPDFVLKQTRGLDVVTNVDVADDDSEESDEDGDEKSSGASVGPSTLISTVLKVLVHLFPSSAAHCP